MVADEVYPDATGQMVPYPEEAPAAKIPPCERVESELPLLQHNIVSLVKLGHRHSASIIHFRTSWQQQQLKLTG